MNVVKKLSMAVLVLLVVVGVVLYISVTNINSIAKSVIEEIGSDVLKTEVSLGAIDISLTDGRVQLSNLTIANPEPFTAEYIFKMDDIVVDVELASLTDGLIEITELSVSGAKVIAEQKGAAINVQKLLDNLESGSSSPSSTPDTETGQSSQPDVLIKLDLLKFVDISTELVSDSLGEKQFTLSSFQINQVGGSKGLPPKEFATALLKPVVKKINDGIKDELKNIVEDEVKDKLKEKLKGKEDELKSKLFKGL